MARDLFPPPLVLFVTGIDIEAAATTALAKRSTWPVSSRAQWVPVQTSHAFQAGT